RLRLVGFPVSPRDYRGLPAFASLSLAGSERLESFVLSRSALHFAGSRVPLRFTRATRESLAPLETPMCP
ncbi:MAG: hypothetical protein ABW068_15075, partial [Candidatus Thiodiazotropha sp.]